MAIDVRPVCADTSAECVFEVEQTIDMVLDIERSKRSRGMYRSLRKLVSEAYVSQMTLFLGQFR